MNGGDDSTPAALAAAWAKLGRKLTKAVRRPERDRFEALVLDLLGLAQPGDPRQEGLLQVGIGAATALAKYMSPDPELLAAAVALPWYDAALLGTRSPLTGHLRQVDWTAAMLLAMAPAGSYRSGPDGERPGYLRQLAALPPQLRAAVIVERDLAAATPAGPAGWGGTGPPLSTVPPFDQAELAALAAGVPPQLLPPGYPAAGSAPSPPHHRPSAVDSPGEAVELVRRNLHLPFGSYAMSVDGDPGFVVQGVELVYQVRWDAPPEAVRPIGPALTAPGDTGTALYREPGWLVDRVTREVIPVDLATPTVAAYVGARRVYPLPPGWQPDGRPPVPDGLGGELATLLSTLDPQWALGVAVEPVVREATARYAAALATEAWPDHLVAWRVGRESVRLLLASGASDADLVFGALLAGRGPAETDTLVDDDAPLWRTAAGDLARAARPRDDETDAAGAARRAGRLAGASVPVRMLTLANARARHNVESELFGQVPAGRAAELAALSPLGGDLPAAQRIIASR